MFNCKIRLISFAGSEATALLEKMLLQLGCLVEISDTKNLLSPASADIRTLQVLFLNGNLSDDCLTQCLEILRHYRCIFVLDKNVLAAAKHLIELADEFVLWPLCGRELKFRLFRLSDRFTNQSIDITPALLQKEFLKLNLVGDSEPFNRILGFIKKVACYGAPVLIEGDTGTGKELVARAVHYMGRRKDRAFVPVNCGSLPDNLMENELFGHKRGAYTDAREDQEGLVVLANGGTLFLDEVDALSPKGQVTLLRFLQDKDFKPLGSKQTRRVDVRVVAATNQPLKNLVERGEFRQDLFFRLNVLSLELPTLRERREDISILANYFVEKFRKRYDQPQKFIPPEGLRLMERYEWPGNVRELENVVHRAFLLSDDASLRVDQHLLVATERRLNEPDRRLCVDLALSYQDAKKKAIEEFESRYLHMLMQAVSGNITQASKLASKERSALGKLLKKHGMNRNDFAEA